MVFTALSWAGLAGAVGIGGEVFSIVIIVLAYACIIGALIMDFTVVRKRRNYYRDKVKAMSKRAVDRIIEASYQERVAKEAARKAKKEARKAGKSSSEASAAADEAYAKAMALATGKIELPEDEELDAKTARRPRRISLQSLAGPRPRSARYQPRPMPRTRRVWRQTPPTPREVPRAPTQASPRPSCPRRRPARRRPPGSRASSRPQSASSRSRPGG